MRAFVCALWLCGCWSAPIETPPVLVTGDVKVPIDVDVKNQVDILFLIDNSGSMTPKQEALKQRLPELIGALRQFASDGKPASYHVGVVTSDLRSNRPGPELLGGQAAQLVDQDRSDPKAPRDCGLGGGVHYLDFDQLAGTSNVAAGATVESTFQCMTSVGSAGDGFEHQLEAVYRALHDCPDDAHCTLAANRGFLRPQAILAAVWLTDEDDCSAPVDTDLFDTTPAALAAYGPLGSFRCTRFGLVHDGALVPFADSQGATLAVTPAPNPPGKLFDVQRYIDFFTHPDGAKANPEDVILVAVSGPSASPTGPAIATLRANPSTHGAYSRCTTENGDSCTIVLDHSCAAAADASYVGDPAVRLRAVVEAAANHDDATSICDPSYAQALDRLGALIRDRIGDGCLQAPIAHPDRPDCDVFDDVIEPDGTHHQVAVPACSAVGNQPPCWHLVDKPRCPAIANPETGQTQQLGLVVERGPGGPPEHTVTHAACETVSYKRP